MIAFAAERSSPIIPVYGSPIIPFVHSIHALRTLFRCSHPLEKAVQHAPDLDNPLA